MSPASNVATVGTLGVLGKGQIGGLRLTYPFVNETASTQALTFGFDPVKTGSVRLVVGNSTISLRRATEGVGRIQERFNAGHFKGFGTNRQIRLLADEP